MARVRLFCKWYGKWYGYRTFIGQVLNLSGEMCDCELSLFGKLAHFQYGRQNPQNLRNLYSDNAAGEIRLKNIDI